ncbi:Protein fam49a [Boothiomyces sp. JEL0838]|nr:Protein fam49a [Boothiomyces sp. JEL0838]
MVSYINIAQPTPDEQEIYAQCAQAISSPSKQNDDQAWDAVVPCVAKLKEYYEFAQQLEQLFPKILGFLCSQDPTVNFEKYQATAFQMGNPNIQNDFSYYRRTVSRMKMSNASGGNVVSDELANRMSLFFAHSNPVTKALIDAVSAGVTMRQLKVDHVCDCFAILAGVSYNKVSKQQTQPHGDALFLRIMVASILFHDHIDPVGAFAKESKINIRASVKTIQQYGGNDTNPLLNVVKFSTVHLNSETTPKATKQLLA